MTEENPPPTRTFPASTIAYSVCNAIFANDRPMSPPEITKYLKRLWEPNLELVHVVDAIEQAVARGRLVKVAETEGTALYDTVLRAPDGKRCEMPSRLKDHKKPTNPHYGWF